MIKKDIYLALGILIVILLIVVIIYINTIKIYLFQPPQFSQCCVSKTKIGELPLSCNPDPDWLPNINSQIQEACKKLEGGFIHNTEENKKACEGKNVKIEIQYLTTIFTATTYGYETEKKMCKDNINIICGWDETECPTSQMVIHGNPSQKISKVAASKPNNNP